MRILRALRLAVAEALCVAKLEAGLVWRGNRNCPKLLPVRESGPTNYSACSFPGRFTIVPFRSGIATSSTSAIWKRSIGIKSAATRSACLPFILNSTSCSSLASIPRSGGCRKISRRTGRRPTEIERYNARVREAMDSALEQDQAPDEIWHVAIEHRLMHAETFAYMLHNLIRRSGRSRRRERAARRRAARLRPR